MVLITLKGTDRTINADELRELLTLVENQETADKVCNKSVSIDGYFAKIEVELDDDGDITLL